MALATSTDGYSFSHSCYATLTTLTGLPQRLDRVSHVRTVSTKAGLFMLYRKRNLLGRPSIYIARSKDGTYWKTIRELRGWPETTAMTMLPLGRGYVLYTGEGNIHCCVSSDLSSVTYHGQAVLKPRADKFDRGPLEVGRVRLTRKGVELSYYTKHEVRGRIEYSVGAALFDARKPRTLLWRADEPLWEQSREESNHRLSPVGIADIGGETLYYWHNEKGQLLVTAHVRGDRLVHIEKEATLELVRHQRNPVISPLPHHRWESKATFNPAAVEVGGRVHVLYRAIGDTDVSVLGYASSRDGLHFDTRLTEPIYVPRESFEGVSAARDGCPNLYGCGGGWGGCEDPRITKIDDRIYMTYVAYDGWSAPRVALTTLGEDDFLNHRWNWSRPVLISEPGVGNKNSVIFPERIKGKFVIFHRIFPNIVIDYVKNLTFDGTSQWLRSRARIQPRLSFWDSRKVGAGAPPIKTDQGWLMIYQSVGFQDPSRYKMGAMLLDLKNPAHVIARSRKPILEPAEPYENEGHKFGVVYPCGAVAFKDQLMVYYGGADTYTCVATAPLKEFLWRLLHHREPRLQPAHVIA